MPPQTSGRTENVGRKVRTQIVRSNPLKADPTRTKMLRASFERELRKRYARLRAEIVKLVQYEDAFGLTTLSIFNEDQDGLRVLTPSVATILNQRFSFVSSSEKVVAYQDWIKNQYDGMVLPTDDAYWEKYIANGYEKGAGRAFDDTYKARRAMAGSQEQMAYYQGTKEQFLQDAFGNPAAMDKVKLLAGRTLTDLQGVNSLMATQMSQVLVDGLTQGVGAIALSKSLMDIVGGNEYRAMRIARTEIIRAHAEGQLDALEKMGVEDVGVMVEWSSAGDDRVCPLCQDLDGVVLKIAEARGIIPRHPNCRCCHVPANVGEPLTTKRRVNYGDGSQSVGQTRSKGDIETGIKDSIAKERKKGSMDEKIRRSRWAGADRVGRIAKARPSSPLYPGVKPIKPSVVAPKTPKVAAKTITSYTPSNSLKEARKWAEDNGGFITITETKPAAEAIAKAVGEKRFWSQRMIEYEQDQIRYGRVVPSHDEITKNWAKMFRSKKAHRGGVSAFKDLDQDLVLRVQNAANDNRANTSFMRYVDKHGDAPIIVRNQELGRTAAAEWRGDAIHVFNSPFANEVVASSVGDIIPAGQGTVGGMGGIAAELRHEYGHGLFTKLSIEQEKQWTSLWITHRDRLGKELTSYASKNASEGFCEAFSVMTDRYFDPTNFTPEMRSLLSLVEELSL